MPFTTPINEDLIWKAHLDKELDEFCKAKVGAGTGWLHGCQRSQPQATEYRVPAPGDEVAIVGIRRRPEMNGARGEVVGAGIDASGRVAVRISGPGSRTMMVRASQLMPLRPRTTARSSSTPALLRRVDDDGGSSVRTASRCGSVVSAASRRAPGSVTGSLRSTRGQVGMQLLVLPDVPAGVAEVGEQDME
mmetsp:Transcript_47466/g.120447  ORF Transcript_47466/g.120447 Transcript_47466/m.120447 type:complete len:191 (-) Transcript_47466:82-654(-)